MEGDGAYRSIALESALRALEYGCSPGADRALTRHLREIRLALQSGSVPGAIRLIDRAWRTMPRHGQILSTIYGRLLSVEDRDHAAALRLLQRVRTPDPDIAALIVRAFWRLRRPDDAMQHLELALKSYCVAPQSLLARESSAALEIHDRKVAGWVGLGPSLQLTGELAFGASAEFLEIRLGEAAVGNPTTTVLPDGRTGFAFQCPHDAGTETLHVLSRGVPLLGSGRRFPLDFALDGRAEGAADGISGWVRVGWWATQPVQLNFEDEYGRCRRLKTRGVPRRGSRWLFRLNARRAGLLGSRIRITALLPDGRWHPLPDTPLLLKPALRINGIGPVRLPRWRAECSVARRNRLPASRRASPIDVIIPVYRGRHETLACIDAVMATIGDNARAIVVDDATEDAALAAALDHLAGAGRITLLRNEQNLGFVRSVNRALALNSGNDVVLLNSDTLVFDDWLHRLSAAAHSAARVGTVTPLSNEGSIASYPRESGAPIAPEAAAALHKLVSSTHPGLSVAVPVGVGFCLYLRYDCLREVGELDATVFGVGYGEEVDFCMRARQRGWSHRIAADVFVYHASGSSFGARRAALIHRSQRLLNLRYPGYDRFIREFRTQAPLRALRRRLDERRLSSFDGRFVLLVTLALQGGVERFVADRGRQLRAQGLFPLVLRPRKPGDARHCELWTDAIDAPNLRYEIPAELPVLRSLLRRLPIEMIEISHFLHLDARVIDAVRGLGVPYDVVLHDYAWICPRVTLIDGTGRYCNEPAISVCESCVRKNGSLLGERISVAALRARSRAWLTRARSVTAPSADAAQRLGNYFRNVRIEVRPHGAAFIPQPGIARSTRGKTVRVAVIGAIGEHKGYHILLACARDALARSLPLEFVVVGYTQDDKPLLDSGRVFVTGRYMEEEVPHLLRREQPDIAFLPSVWPETWCYSLDHAVRAGLPVVAFDLGAIAERLRGAGLGVLLPLQLTARQINDRILARVAEDRTFSEADDGGIRAQRSPPYVQRSLPGNDDGARMDENRDLTTMKPSIGEPSAEEGLSASLQVLPLPTGLYMFSVKAGAPLADRVAGKLHLPAMHVGLGPGVRSEQVEFIAAPGNEGAWLFAPGDILIAKVDSPSATLILTSVRASNGDVLSIEVERLESRPQVTSSTLGVAANLAGGNGFDSEFRGRGMPQAKPAVMPAADTPAVPLQIKTHIRTRGDMNFSSAHWAGRVAPGLWIESFSVQPLAELTAQDIEYKGLTGTGFETPWLSNDQICGTKGMSVPLVGFAIRLKQRPEASSYDCEYSGYYQSGVTVGPLRNGAPCRSTVANDPLEGIQIRIVKRPKTAAEISARAPAEPRRSSDKAPPSGRHLSGDAAKVGGAPKAVKRINPGEPRSRPERGAHSARRSKIRPS